MSQFKTIEQKPAYDVAGGVTNFDPVRIESENEVTVQVFYTGLDAEDLNIKLQQALVTDQAPDFNDVVDASDVTIEKNLESGETSHIFNITGFNSDYARMIIDSVGAVTAGIINRIVWRIKK